MVKKQSVSRSSPMLRILALTATLAACDGNQQIQPTEGPVIVASPEIVAEVAAPIVVELSHDGAQMSAGVHANFTSSNVTATIDNNTDSTLTFTTALQFLDVAAFDVVSPVVGSNVVVNASSTSSSFNLAYPFLPDGYYNVALTVAAASASGGPLDVVTGTSGYLYVASGVNTPIDFGEWNTHTGGAPIVEDLPPLARISHHGKIWPRRAPLGASSAGSGGEVDRRSASGRAGEAGSLEQREFAL